MTSLLNLKETKEAKNFIVDTLHNFKDNVKSVASKISAQDITALTTSPGPATILSVGLPLIGVYLAKKKHDSPLARKIARFLGADVNSVNEQFVFDKLNNPEYYNELRKNILNVITERGDISPLTKMLDLTEPEAWEIFNTMKEIIFSAEVVNQFSIIVPSLKNIETEVGNVRGNLNALLKALKSPIKVSNDIDDIASELRVHESTGISHVHRREDDELEQAILNNDNKIILIIGGPGSGKSKMLYNALGYCKEYFSTFFLMKEYFREGDEKSLDLALDNNDIDNFVIVWDDLHEKDPKFVTDIIERINSIGRSKNFRFIGASRKDIIFMKEEGLYRVNLHRFDNVAELVSKCTKAFNVKLKPDVTHDIIFSKGDGTPYYIISLFEMFKNSEIAREDLDLLPSTVTDLWRNQLERAIHNSMIETDHLNAFRSIGLLSHASSEASRISKDKVREVYKSVFHGDLGRLDYALDGLVDNMFVLRVDGDYYYAHDSHIEALESKYPLEKYHVQNFTISENDSGNLWVFTTWAIYRGKIEYLEIISSKIKDIDPNDPYAWNNKGLALFNLGRYEEAIECYGEAIELNPNGVYMWLVWNNKGLALDNLGNHKEAISCYDKAIELNPNYPDVWVSKGKALSSLPKYEESIKCYDKAIELNPNYPDAWYYKGLVLHIQNNDEESIKCYDKAIELNPNSDGTWYGKGLALGNLGRYEESIKCYDKAIELNPNYPDVWVSKGLALFNLGNHKESIKCYDKAIELDPNYVNAWHNKGLALGNLGRYEEAIKCYDKAIELDPNSDGTWYGKGLFLHIQNNDEEAIKCYDKAIELDPNYVNAWDYKGKALFNLGRYEEAIKCYDKVIEIEPINTNALYSKGVILSNLGKYEEAIRCYDKAIELDPKYLSAWNNKGLALFNLGRYEEAIRCYDKAIELDLYSDAAWNNKGLALFNLGRYEEAIRCYDKAIELDPSHVSAWYGKGLVLHAQKNFEEAIRSYDKAIELDPNYPDAWYYKGVALDNLGKYEEAIRSYDKAIELNPKFADSWNSKGFALVNLGNNEEAIVCYDKAIELDPNYVGVWYNRGNALLHSGKYEEAIVSYDRALEIDPSFAYAWHERGLALLQLGKHDEAIVSYNKAIEVDSNYASAWYDRACTEVLKGDIENGLNDLKKAIEIDKNYIESAKQDEGFESIRNEERFKALVR